MKIFKNKQLTESVDPKNLDLGIVEGGSTQKYTFYLQNDHPRGEVRNLKAIVEHKEINILKCPTTIARNESAEFEFEWKCDPLMEIYPEFAHQFLA